MFARFVKKVIGKWENVLFVIPLCFFSFAYGVGAMHYQVFPYEVVQDVRRGLRAYRALEPAKLPSNVMTTFKGDIPQLPMEKLESLAGEEYILVAGGFYQLMDECPDFGCIAWVTDREGNIVHRWSADPDTVISGLDNLTGPINNLSIYISGLALAPDGGIVAVLQGRNTFPYQVGIVKFDIDGNVEWKRFDFAHHWPTVSANGEIIVPSARLIEDRKYFANTATEVVCDEEVLQSEGVRIYGADGAELRTFWFDDIFAEADYPGLAYALPDGCNPHHVNGISEVTPAAADLLPNATVGDLAVSLRQPSGVAIIDRQTGELRHYLGGRFSAQHSPGFLADGTLTVFDNRGGDIALGGSRIVSLNAVTDELRTVFPTGDEKGDVLPFFSREAGVVSFNTTKDRMLISETRAGRILEVDVNRSTPLWVYKKDINLRPFYDARGLKSDTDFVRFSAQGAYYVDPANPVLAAVR